VTEGRADGAPEGDGTLLHAVAPERIADTKAAAANPPILNDPRLT
jgi:hypothetical protein